MGDYLSSPITEKDKKDYVLPNVILLDFQSRMCRNVGLEEIDGGLIYVRTQYYSKCFDIWSI